MTPRTSHISSAPPHLQERLHQQCAGPNSPTTRCHRVKGAVAGTGRGQIRQQHHHTCDDWVVGTCWNTIGKWIPDYPLVICYIAIENGHRNSGFSHEKWWFSIAMLVYQRVKCLERWKISTTTPYWGCFTGTEKPQTPMARQENIGRPRTTTPTSAGSRLLLKTTTTWPYLCRFIFPFQAIYLWTDWRILCQETARCTLATGDQDVV